MEISELKEGLLVQSATNKGHVLYRVSTVYEKYATLQWVFTWRDGEGEFPRRTTVVQMTEDKLAPLRLASAQLENRWNDALDAQKDN